MCKRDRQGSAQGFSLTGWMATLGMAAMVVLVAYSSVLLLKHIRGVRDDQVRASARRTPLCPLDRWLLSVRNSWPATSPAQPGVIPGVPSFPGMTGRNLRGEFPDRHVACWRWLCLAVHKWV